MAREARAAVLSGEARPDRVTLVAFVALVFMVGTNTVTVKTTVEELAPLWSGGLRFAAAALILGAVVLLRRQPLPRGRAMAGVVLFGMLSFGGFFAFAYIGIQRLPVSVAAVTFAAVPLLTFLAAVVHGLESFRWLTLAGAVLAVAGIAFMVGGVGNGRLSVLGLLAMLAAGVCAAEAAVIAKRFPPVSPLMMNALGMTIGAVVLLGLSFAWGESHAIPRTAPTWIALGYLVLIGSIALFITYLFVLQRWTASGASYFSVVAPIVAVGLAAIFQGERITLAIVGGGVLVLAGVYVGALLHTGKREPEARPEEATVASALDEEDRAEFGGVPADCLRCP
jgi:drug/metabolite transporter (DMT)-like permease